MKTISASKIKEKVSDLCIKANLVLPLDVLKLLKNARRRETGQSARSALDAIITNAAVARRQKLAICQDTGLPVVFLELGQDLRIRGSLKQAIYQGVESGYRRGYLRESVVTDPVSRGKPVYRGAVIHTEIVKGNRLKITLMPKGFGCENKSQLVMLSPTAGVNQIKEFIVGAVRKAGADACPPYIIGVGIGGTADYACLLAKIALLGRRTRSSRLEKELLKGINRLKIGPMGMGGKTTALTVVVESAPTHIAGLPVAVNISCHALRRASTVL